MTGRKPRFATSGTVALKINKPDYTYVRKLGLNKVTKYARLFQTINPFAYKYNLSADSKFDKDDYEKVAEYLLDNKGTILMLWKHKSIPHIG